MPNLTAQQMLARLPVRMADGGVAEGVSAAYREAMAKGGQQTVNDYYANLRAEGEKYLANPNAPTGPEAYNVLLQSGISTSDLKNAGVNQAVLDKIFTVQQPAGQTTATGQVIPGAATQFNTPAGMTSAYTRSPDLMNEAQRLTGLGQDGRAALDAQGRNYVAGLQQGGIDANERAQMLEYATERGYTFDDLTKAGVNPSLLFNIVTPPPKPYVPPVTASSAFPQTQTTFPQTQTTFTSPTVYQPLSSQPDIFAAGQPALDTAFRNSAPRTAIEGMPGYFDYTPAAQLRPATGAGYTFTPPSVTSRPRSLLSPSTIKAYGGMESASQKFARERAASGVASRAGLETGVRAAVSQLPPALQNLSTYNQLRNRLMSQEFGDPTRALDPQTLEGAAFLAALEKLKTSGTTTGTKGGTTTVAANGSTAAGGYADPIEAEALTYGGFRAAQGGLVKKSEGSAQEELARFANGGPAIAGRKPLSPTDPLYIQTDAPRNPDAVAKPITKAIPPAAAASQAPISNAELLAQIDRSTAATPSAITPERDPVRIESRSMLENISAGMVQIPQTVMDYGSKVMQSEDPLARFGADVSALGSGMIEGAKQDPVGFTLDMLPVIGEARSARDAVKFSDLANEARAANNLDAAMMYEQMSTLAAAGAAPLAGMASRIARRAAGAPEAMMRMADPIYTHIPTTENPFVGRLDSFVTELKGRTTLPDLVKQMRGKFRDYDIQRVQRVMQDVPADTKFTPSEILEKLQASYDPSGLKITQLDSPGNFWESMDNPWYGDVVKPRQSTIVLSSTDPVTTGSLVSPEAAKDAQEALLRLDPKYRNINTSSFFDMTNLNDFNNYFKPLVATLSQDPFEPRTVNAITEIGRVADKMQTSQKSQRALRSFFEELRNEASGPLTFEKNKNRLLRKGGLSPRKTLTKAYLDAFQESYVRLRSQLPIVEMQNKDFPVFRPEDFQDVDPSVVDKRVTFFVDANLYPLTSSMIDDRQMQITDSITELEAKFAEDQDLKDFLASKTKSRARAPGSNPSYTGQHASLTNNVANQISFSRATDVTANIPEIGPNAKGIYVHELQSDLLDDIRKIGGPRTLSVDQLKERLPEYNKTLNDLDDKLASNNNTIAQLKRDRQALKDQYPDFEGTVEGRATLTAVKALAADIDKLNAENQRLFGRIELAQKARANVKDRIAGTFPEDEQIDEAFVGMETNAKAIQQLMIKAAVKAAVDRGLDFVALTSPVHSAQPQLYKRIPENARDVVNDLGEGFYSQQIELKTGNKGPFKTTAIVWGRDAVGKEGVNRLLTRGVPFKKGGEVSSSPTSQELLAQIDRSTANSPAPATGTASSAPAREVTESQNMLRRLSDAFGQNVTAPVVGSMLDMTTGLGDLAQMGLKAGAGKLGIETKPFTPVSSALQESLGVAGYDPYSPAALAASVLLPAAGPLRTAAAATRPMMSMAAAPGSARETLSLIKPILDREASVGASAELAAMGAREVAPDNFTAEIAAAIAGGAGYNTLDNILSSASRGPMTSGMAAKEKGGVFRPLKSESNPAQRSNLGEYLDRYESAFISYNVPEEVSQSIVEKARRYFTNSYGTADDPLRIAILEGKLNPRPEGSQYGFRDYLVDAAKTSYRQQKDRVAAGDNEASYEISSALQDFSKIYDRDTGLAKTIYTRGEVPRDEQRALERSVDARLIAQGLPPELANAQVDLRNLNSPGYIPLSDKSFMQDLEAGNDKTLAMALQNREPIYDLKSSYGGELPFLEPQTIAEAAQEIPLDTLKKMSFPELVIKTAEITNRDAGLKDAINKAQQNKKVLPKYFLNEGVRPVIDAGPNERWYQITDSKYTALEGNAMGHSVGGYAKPSDYNAKYRTEPDAFRYIGGKEAFDKGYAQVYTLRNTKTGIPAITVEIQNETPVAIGQTKNPTVSQIQGFKNGIPFSNEPVFKLLKTLGVTPENTPTSFAYYRDLKGEELGDTKYFDWAEMYEAYLDTNSTSSNYAQGGYVTKKTKGA